MFRLGAGRLSSGLEVNGTRTVRLIWIGLIAGVVLRLFHYFHCRSMWFDEACLTLNIVNRSAGELLGFLSFHQAAPVGFLWVEKAAAILFGEGELSLRLPLLLGGLIAMFLFAHVARTALPGEGAAVAVLLFALSWPLVRFATEVKPYGLDALAAAGIWWIVSRVEQAGFGWRAAAAVGGVGAALVWVSFPSILVLPAGVVVLVWRAWTHRDRYGLGPVSLVVGAWSLSGVLSFLLALRPLGRNRYYAEFWATTFMPLPPWSVEWFDWFVHSGAAVLRSALGMPLSLPAVIAGCVGAVSLCHRRPATAAFLLTPIVLAAVASALHRYPFAGRFLLFAAPAAFGLIGEGTAYILRACRHRWVAPAGWLVAGALVTQPLWLAGVRVVSPHAPQESRSVLAQLQARAGPTCLVVVDRALECPYLYYRGRFDLDGLDHRVVGSPPPGRTADEVLSEVVSRSGADEVWLLLSDLGGLRPAAVGQRFASRGGCVCERGGTVRAPGVALFRYGCVDCGEGVGASVKKPNRNGGPDGA